MKLSAVAAHPSSDLLAIVAFDIGMDLLHWRSQMLDVLETQAVANRVDAVRALLGDLQARALEAGFKGVRVVLEPSGVYHQTLVKIAKRKSMVVDWVSPEAGKHLRVLESNDAGKTDVKDPRVIEMAAMLGKTLVLRDLPQPYQLMREWNRAYERAEEGMVRAKCVVHVLLKQLLPDFDFTNDFLYDRSGRALAHEFGFNPFRITRQGVKGFNRRMKRLVPRIRSRSIERVFAHAEASIRSGLDEALAAVLELEMRQTWEELELHESRRQQAAEALERLYDEARAGDAGLPPPTDGVMTKVRMARLVAETGPLSDFANLKQLYRYTAMNLVENKSGRYKGRTKLSKKGRTLACKVLNQAAFALSKKDRLFGPYYHTKKEKMEGAKAMTAVARKVLKMFWGWYKSGGEFDVARVFACESTYRAAA